jgi:hypothetical protein
MRFRDVVPGSAAWLLAAQTANGASLCIAPGDNGVVSRGCGQVTTRPMGWMGFTTVGIPCQDFPTEYDDYRFCPDTDTYVPGENDFEFAWSISASNLDPYQTTAAIGGAQTLYVWFVCSARHLEPRVGLEAAAFALVGDITVDSLRTTNGFLNVGTDTEPLLAVGGCPVGPVVAAEIHVAIPTPVDDESWGRIKAGYSGQSSRP